MTDNSDAVERLSEIKYYLICSMRIAPGFHHARRYICAGVVLSDDST